MFRHVLLIGTLCLASLTPALLERPQDPLKGAPQDPKRPTVPADARPLGAVEEPFLTAIERRDLIQRFEPKNPYEGMYRLQSMVRMGGRTVLGAEGYLVMGRKFLSLHLQAPGANPDLPYLRAGFRRYRLEDDVLRMTTLVGHFNNLDGEVVIEESGFTVERRISVVGSTLQVLDEDGGYLEFVRIE